MGTAIAYADSAGEYTPVNKLLYMYRYYYLPFSIEFKEGKSVNDILPLIEDQESGNKRLIKADELSALDEEWNEIKKPIQQKSLFLSTKVPLNGSVRISSHLASHRVMITRTALDPLDLNERLLVKRTLEGKPAEVQANYKQLLFLKSFLGNEDQGKFNLFVVSASWCESCKEYRVLLESYFRTFLPEGLNVHSLVVEDAKEQIFEHPFLKELFPNPKKYSHNSIPRFIAIETMDGKPVIFEEGEALAAAYDRFFKEKVGYLDKKVALFAKKRKKPSFTLRRLASPSQK